MNDQLTLLFDLGGVIMDIRRDNAVEALRALGMADADDFLGEYGQKGPFLALERGKSPQVNSAPSCARCSVPE